MGGLDVSIGPQIPVVLTAKFIFDIEGWVVVRFDGIFGV